jgi:hypothetical protein
VPRAHAVRRRANMSPAYPPHPHTASVRDIVLSGAGGVAAPSVAVQEFLAPWWPGYALHVRCPLQADSRIQTPQAAVICLQRPEPFASK